MATTREKTTGAETIVEDKSVTNTPQATNAGSAKPGVEVYDTDSPSTKNTIHDEHRPRETTTVPSTTGKVGTTTGEVGTVTPTVNWTSMIVGILVVVALIVFLMWLF